jgi:hypothetical protein
MRGANNGVAMYAFACSLPVAIVYHSPSPREQAHPHHDETHLEVRLQGVLLPHERPHEHDWHLLAALGQHLYGEDDVLQCPGAEEGATNARESQDRKLGRGDGA